MNESKTKDQNNDISSVQRLGLSDNTNNIDFWQDAQEFLESQLPPDFNDKLIQYITAKDYNQNEFRLFKHMLENALGYHGTIVLLTHYN